MNNPWKGYESGFQIFLPISNIKHYEILFPTKAKLVYNHYIKRLVILKSHQLEKISCQNGWSFVHLNFMRLIAGLSMKDFNLIEQSINVAHGEAKNKAFHYIILHMQEDIQNPEKLQSNFSFYRSLCNWILKRFNEHIIEYKDQSIKDLEPLLHTLREKLFIPKATSSKFSSLQTSLGEVAFFSQYQKTLKDIKLEIRRQDNQLLREQKAKYDELEYKTTPKPSVYNDRQPLELLLKGKVSAMLYACKDKGYHLEDIQNNLKTVMLYYMSQSFLGIEFATSVLEDIGLNSKQVFFEYYKNSLRRDMRKRIRHYFKEIGVTQLTDDTAKAFLKINEILCPLDSVTIAIRRRRSRKPDFRLVLTDVRKIQETQKFWSQNPKDSGHAIIENRVEDFREHLSSFNFGIFELDDFHPDETSYMERYHTITKTLKNFKDIEGPFKLEDFKKFERHIQEMNSKVSKDLTRGRFEPNSYSKMKEKCMVLFNSLMAKFLGREVDVSGIMFKKVNFYKLIGYFQMKLSIIEKLNLEQMLSIIIERLELDIQDHIEVFGLLNLEEQRKYLDFLLRYQIDNNQILSCLELFKWLLANNRTLFEEYFIEESGWTATPEPFQKAEHRSGILFYGTLVCGILVLAFWLFAIFTLLTNRNKTNLLIFLCLQVIVILVMGIMNVIVASMLSKSLVAAKDARDYGCFPDRIPQLVMSDFIVVFEGVKTIYYSSLVLLIVTVLCTLGFILAQKCGRD